MTIHISVRRKGFSTGCLFPVLLLFVSLCLVPASARARFRITPKISLSQEYNDNVFLDPSDNEDSDWITTIEPGFLLNWNTAAIEMKLDYSLRFKYFNDNTYLNETSFKDVQRGKLTSTLFPDGNFTVLSQGDISRVVVDESDRTSEENEYINRATLYHFFVNPKYRLRLTSSANAVFGYRFELATYDQVEHADEYDYDEPNDYYQHILSLELVKQLSADSSLLAGYYFTDYHTEENDPGEINEDFTRHDLVLGIEQKLGSRFTLLTRGGLVYFDFEDSGRENGRSWNLGLNYRISRSLTLETLYTYDYTPSVSQGLSKTEDWSAFLKFDHRLSADLHLFHNKTTYAEGLIDDSDNYTEDKSTGAALRLSYPLTRYLTANLNTDYSYWKFKPDNEKEDRYGIGPSLDYKYHKLTFSLSYFYRVNNSDDDENDYRNNIGMLEISWEL